MNEIYFDNSATTVCSKEVCDAVVKAMKETYGNPSSSHLKGVEAEKIQRSARETIAATLRCSEKEIFFTSGGTEADNWALIGSANALRRSGMHLVTTCIEHPAVLQTMHFLENQGFEVTYLDVDSTGHILLQDLEKALRNDTILVSVMLVNNEIGSIMPVEEAALIVHKKCPGAIFHTDAVQAYGKIPINARHIGADLISVSGHKIHGPKGTGFLYIKEKTHILPFILGGGQQNGMRSGTENVAGAAGLAAAAKDACLNLPAYTEQMRLVKDRLTAGLKKMEGVIVHSGEGETGAPHIVNASFTGVRSEVLLHALEDRRIYVSAGSACSSNRKHVYSAVLSKLKLPKEQLESALRFSFSHFNTIEEVDCTLAALNEFLPVLRRYTRH